jgi:Helix-turn-helix domain
MRHPAQPDPWLYTARSFLESSCIAPLPLGQLAASDLTVTEICFAIGFHSPGSFSALFRRAVGQPPRDYRLQARKRDQAIARVIPLCLRTMYAA